MKSATLVFTLIVLMTAAMAAGAWTLDDVVISEEVGSGVNASYVIIDYGYTSYALKYNWTEPINGLDMLFELESLIPGFDFGIKQTAWGPQVVSFSYNGSYENGDGTSDSNGYYWGYFTGDSPFSLEESWIGAPDRNLFNGSWDAWKWTTYPPGPINIPGLPEPSSAMALVSMIGLAGPTLLLRSRRK